MSFRKSFSIFICALYASLLSSTLVLWLVIVFLMFRASAAAYLLPSFCSFYLAIFESNCVKWAPSSSMLHLTYFVFFFLSACLELPWYQVCSMCVYVLTYLFLLFNRTLLSTKRKKPKIKIQDISSEIKYFSETTSTTTYTHIHFESFDRTPWFPRTIFFELFVVVVVSVSRSDANLLNWEKNILLCSGCCGTFDHIK